MNADKLFNLLGTIVVVAGITAAVLPNRETANIISAFGSAFSTSVRAAVNG